jgi:molecular chaperone DnaK
VELRNTADSIVYQTRRTIDETKEKLSEEVVNPVLEKLKELESLIVTDEKPVSDEDLDETSIQSRIQELEELMHSLSSKLYEAASAEVSEEENESDDDGDVVEADFEVLDSDDEDTDE